MVLFFHWFALAFEKSVKDEDSLMSLPLAKSVCFNFPSGLKDFLIFHQFHV
jgi:hypothetical protein